jgi:hypothetical protein
MAKKQSSKKGQQRGRSSRTSPPPRSKKYSPAEIAMAVLGAALLIMIAGIIITSLFGSG